MTTFDLLSIATIASGCALLIGVIGAGVLRLLQRRSIVIHIAVVAIGAVATTLSGVTGVAAAMFLSAHDFTVVLYVGAISSLVATLLSLKLSRQIVRASRELTSASRRLGEGSETAFASRSHGSELSDLACELSAASTKLTRSRKRERTMEGSHRELIAWISQDLKAPLTGLLTLAQALESGSVSDTDRTYKQLRCEIDRVADMVDDLFELSHSQAETPAPASQRIALYDLVSEAIANVGPVACARGIVIEGSDISSVAVRVDNCQLVRALSSLLLGAIRHTPAAGAVTVSARAQNDGRAAIWVTDSCGGAPQEDLNHAFDTAWRGDGSTAVSGSQAVARRLPTMKGLAVVKDIVEASGGMIVVTNVAQGCRFKITLPLAAAAEQDEPKGALNSGWTD